MRRCGSRCPIAIRYAISPNMKAGLAVEDNDPVIIRDAVAEMLTRLDGGASSDADVADLRMRADRIYEAHGHFGMATLARGFLRAHGDLIA